MNNNKNTEESALLDLQKLEETALNYNAVHWHH